ncbi:hypothetical protein SARC_11913, partial [Sphaeroforma arctica JP610]
RRLPLPIPPLRLPPHRRKSNLNNGTNRNRHPHKHRVLLPEIAHTHTVTGVLMYSLRPLLRRPNLIMTRYTVAVVCTKAREPIRMQEMHTHSQWDRRTIAVTTPRTIRRRRKLRFRRSLANETKS